MIKGAGVARQIADARPRVIAALAAYCRDLDLAEDAFAEASIACLNLDEPPDHFGAWLLTAGKRKVLDAIRKRASETRAVEAQAILDEGETDMGEVIQLPDPIPDERMRLLFICCHPALAIEARVAVALRVICGLPVGEIARVFVPNEATMFQRITRAKGKIRDAGIAFELPARKDWKERLDAVLLTLELAYTAAYQDAAGERDGELAAEVDRLAQLVAELLPEEPEAQGLAALVSLARSREAARVDDIGAMVPLSRQDTKLWDAALIEQARVGLDKAASHRTTGPYQVMATIRLTHARRAFDGTTDWTAILALYDALMLMRPGLMVALNRALALAQVEGPQAGLAALDDLPEAKLKNARPLHVARADLLARCGDVEGAAAAIEAALALELARAERLFLERKRIALAG